MPKLQLEVTEEQQKTIDRVMKASKDILSTYQKVNEFLNSDDEFRAAVGLAQVAAGLTNEMWNGDNNDPNA